MAVSRRRFPDPRLHGRKGRTGTVTDVFNNNGAVPEQYAAQFSLSSVVAGSPSDALYNVSEQP